LKRLKIHDESGGLKYKPHNPIKVERFTMTKAKFSIAVLALTAMPVVASADNVAVSLSAVLTPLDLTNTVIDTSCDSSSEQGGTTGGCIAGDVSFDGLSTVSAISVAAAFGPNAAANTAAVVGLNADRTFANAGAGPDLVTSGQLFDANPTATRYEAAVSFGNSQE
jgi:hypothetical protein